MRQNPLLEIVIEGATAYDAFDSLLVLPATRLNTDPAARRLVERARQRVEPAELRLPENTSIERLLDWVAENLESEEGLLDVDTPPYLANTIKDAVALLNDPLQAMPCARCSPSAFVFFDRA